MKNVVLNILTISIFGFSCQKGNEPVIPPAADQYMNLKTGSTWNYELIDNAGSTNLQFTITSTSTDSTINSRTYHVFVNSSGSANEYYNITGNEYYNFRRLPTALGGASVEYLYLKDNIAVGARWDQSFPITVSGVVLNATLTNTITEKGISKTVKGIVYNDVIHVTTTIAIATLPPGALTTDIQSFYTAKIGLIDSKNKIDINFAGFADSNDQQTNLNSSDVK